VEPTSISIIPHVRSIPRVPRLPNQLSERTLAAPCRRRLWNSFPETRWGLIEEEKLPDIIRIIIDAKNTCTFLLFSRHSAAAGLMRSDVSFLASALQFSCAATSLTGRALKGRGTFLVRCNATFRTARRALPRVDVSINITTRGKLIPSLFSIPLPRSILLGSTFT